VTLSFSRLSRSHATLARPLAAGVLGANLVLFPRVLIASLVISPAVALALLPRFLAPMAVAALLWMTGMRDTRQHAAVPQERNPLQVWPALQMAAMFQLVLFGLVLATGRFGLQGLMGSAAVLGLTDVDALTMSMTRAAAAGSTEVPMAATAITLGILVNTFVKLGIAIAIGRSAYRNYTAAGLAAIAIAVAAAFFF
jgi:uncharacterized membrane protein (DUF4010 family)